MFHKAQIKLTILYSTLFLLLFLLFSFGIYEWMNNSFGEGYIMQVEQKEGIDTDTINKNAKVVTIAGDVALDELLQILFILNGTLLIVIPIVSWFLAKRTLTPIQSMHNQQRQFVSDASHEMRTPLSIITGEIDVTISKKRNAKEYEKTLQSTKEETQRLSRLVDSLLFLAKDDQLAQELIFEEVDITDILNEVMQALQQKSKKKKIPVTFVTDKIETTPIVKGHTQLLYQLFYNLLDNAIIYTPPKGKIKIKIIDTKHTIEISIQDTGIGIAKDQQQKILNRFYRVDSARSKTKGYGLGLAIATTIVTRHNGQLLITSLVNKGSTFTVILPKV